MPVNFDGHLGGWRASSEDDGGDDAEFPEVLVPYVAEEAMKITGKKGAAEIAGVDPSTMRRWCVTEGLGRRQGRPWLVSRVALRMYLDGDKAALKAYHSGDLTSDLITKYYDRLGLSQVLKEKLSLANIIADSAHSARSGVEVCTHTATFR
jgi:hypothetical protein